MTIIPQDMIENQEINTTVFRFFHRFKVSKILNQCNAYKQKGISVMDLFRYILCLVFSHRSMYMQMLTGSFKEDFSKNSVYRFLNNIKQIYSRCKKCRGRSKYLLSVTVMVRKENPIPSKLVCVRNKNKKKDWLVLLSTDTSLSEEEIIRIYGKRWDIEVFFKMCKSYLQLSKECRSLSYDALTAHTALVFTRYMLLAVEKRSGEDDRSMGELFFRLIDEIADITFNTSMALIMQALLDTIVEFFQISENESEKFMNQFIEKLPQYLQNSLLRLVTV